MGCMTTTSGRVRCICEDPAEVQLMADAPIFNAHRAAHHLWWAALEPMERFVRYISRRF